MADRPKLLSAGSTTFGRFLDDLVVTTVADVRKAVRWNSPFYSVEGPGWFLNPPLLHPGT